MERSYHYRLLDGEYCLFYGDELQRRMPEVSICYSKTTFGANILYVLHKHGSPDMIKQWHENTVKKYAASGFQEEIESMGVITGKYPIEELNRMLDTSGYLGIFLRKNGLFES